MATWRRVRKGDPCPICGKDHHCAFHAESLNELTGEMEPEWVKCMRCGPTDAPAVAGWTCEHAVKGGKGLSEGWKWNPPGFVAGTKHKLGAEELEQYRKSKAAKEKSEAKREADKIKRNTKLAGMAWGKADPSKLSDEDRAIHERRILAYLASRGIPMRIVESKVPRVLRYNPQTPEIWSAEKNEWQGSPAMIAKVVKPGVPGEDGRHDKVFCGIHRTFLDVGEEASQTSKRHKSRGEAKKALGPISGGAIRLCEVGEENIAGGGPGVLLVGEGIETVMSAWVATRGLYAAWACISTAHLKAVQLPADDFGEAIADVELDKVGDWIMKPRADAEETLKAGQLGRVHTIIVAADLDASEDGQKAAHFFAWKVMNERPWITVEVALPMEAHYPELVRTSYAGSGAARQEFPWPRVGKGVDWNDVLQHAGADMTARGITHVADTLANARRLEGWKGGIRAGCISRSASDGRQQSGEGHGTSVDGGRSEGPQAAAQEHRESAGSTRDSKGDSGGGQGNAGSGVGGDPPGNRRSGTSLWKDDNLVSDKPLDQARAWLTHAHAPELGVEDKDAAYAALAKAKRAGRSVSLRYWNDQWFEYTGKCWKEIPPKVARAPLWNWLNGKWIVDGRGNRVELAPGRDWVSNVMEAVVTDAIVHADSMPCWINPTFGEDGLPRWGTAAPGLGKERAEAREATLDAQIASSVSDGPPKSVVVDRLRTVIAFRNCLADFGDWAQGKLRVMRHRETWFSTSVLPYDLPYERILQASSADDALGAGEDIHKKELLQELCPTWMKFLQDAFSGDTTSIRALSQFFGRSLVPGAIPLDNFPVFLGPGGSGKGTISRAWWAMLGEDNCVSTSFEMLLQRFHMSSWVGKAYAEMSDAHLGKWTDGTLVMERIKALSARDPTLIERKHSPHTPSIRLPALLAIYCNEMPSLFDASNALIGRIVLFHMKKSYRGTEKEDPSIRENVPKEAQGILVWALYGLKDLLARIAAGQGYTKPESGVEKLREFERDSSPVRPFVEDCCTMAADPATSGEEPWVLVRHLYAAWILYAKEQAKEHPGSIDWFGKKLNACVAHLKTRQVNMQERDEHGQVREARVRCYVGIRLDRPPAGYVAPPLTGAIPGAPGTDKGQRGSGVPTTAASSQPSLLDVKGSAAQAASALSSPSVGTRVASSHADHGGDPNQEGGHGSIPV